MHNQLHQYYLFSAGPSTMVDGSVYYKGSTCWCFSSTVGKIKSSCEQFVNHIIHWLIYSFIYCFRNHNIHQISKEYPVFFWRQITSSLVLLKIQRPHSWRTWFFVFFSFFSLVNKSFGITLLKSYYQSRN